LSLLRSGITVRCPDAALTRRKNTLIGQARRMLGAYDRAEMMIQAGLYATGTDPMIDAAIRVWPALDAFLAEDEPNGVSASFARLEECLSAAALPV